MRILLVFAMLLVTSPALCQDTKSGKTKFYNFDELIIEGKVVKPRVQYIDARQKVKFERLLNLKKDFLKNLKSTAKETALR